MITRVRVNDGTMAGGDGEGEHYALLRQRRFQAAMATMAGGDGEGEHYALLRQHRFQAAMATMAAIDGDDGGDRWRRWRRSMATMGRLKALSFGILNASRRRRQLGKAQSLHPGTPRPTPPRAHDVSAGT